MTWGMQRDAEELQRLRANDSDASWEAACAYGEVAERIFEAYQALYVAADDKDLYAFIVAARKLNDATAQVNDIVFEWQSKVVMPLTVIREW